MSWKYLQVAISRRVFSSLKLINHNVFVDSAGTGGWHIGELPDARSIEIAKQNQIDISDQRCRKFKVNDFEDFDFIYVMDSSNLSDVLSTGQNGNPS